jgi:hypothetical protein
VKQHILEPLNLTDTYYNATEAMVTGRRSEGYLKQGKDGVRCRAEMEGRVGSEDAELPKSCIGQARSLGWWKDGSALEKAIWVGVITSSTDMVCP